MKKQIKMIFAVVIGLLVMSSIIACASAPTGPVFGQPSELQKVLNTLADQFPIDIAGKEVKLSFEGDFWRGQVDGKDSFAGECNIVENEGGAIITLNQSYAFIDTGKTNPVTGAPIATWQKTPGLEIVLEYVEGPPAILGKAGN